jgi:hypothetical protein
VSRLLAAAVAEGRAQEFWARFALSHTANLAEFPVEAVLSPTTPSTWGALSPALQSLIPAGNLMVVVIASRWSA